MLKETDKTTLGHDLPITRSIYGSWIEQSIYKSRHMTTILAGPWLPFIPIFGHYIRCWLR